MDTRRAALAALLALPLLASPARAEPTLGGYPLQPADEPDCALLLPGSEDLTIPDCLRCHTGSGSGHPVGLDYVRQGGAPAGHGIPLRPASEAIRRGAFLPGGELRCTTCHDGRSPWRFKLAIPPGAAVRPAVNPRDPATYDPAAAPAPVRPGDSVGTKPLCLLCHALD